MKTADLLMDSDLVAVQNQLRTFDPVLPLRTAKLFLDNP